MFIYCRYGPYLYAVVMLGGLYLALDVLVLYFVYASDGDGASSTENERVFKVSSGGRGKIANCILHYIS